nr:MAG TPA: hypothetical protein [Caudoviricetes sp.]
MALCVFTPKHYKPLLFKGKWLLCISSRKLIHSFISCLYIKAFFLM